MKNRLQNRLERRVSILLAIIVLALLAAPNGYAQRQQDSRTFNETGKTVNGRFLQYWNTHGGLAQQGYPISDQFVEISDTDGKPYTVQYFERSAMELHPENIAPNDVLLSLLGGFYYRQRYPGGAPGQVVSNSLGAVLFKETGHTLGGKFLRYWQEHGGLTQQGYPISDEFNEVSTLDGKTYLVQYFERAVFELHPEYAGTTNEVLLSQLGAFRYKDKYLQPNPAATSIPTIPTIPTATPIPTIAPIAPTPIPVPPTSTPMASPPNSDCSEVASSINMIVTPNCGPRNTRFVFHGMNFRGFERVAIWVTDPDQSVFGARFLADADVDGKVDDVYIQSDTSFQAGTWAITMEGQSTHTKAIGYFKVIIPIYGSGDCSGIPANQGMTVKPGCAPAGVEFELDAFGFQRGEAVGRYYTSPTGEVVQGSSQSIAREGGTIPTIVFPSSISSMLGIWAATFEGTESHHKSIGYFKVTHP